MANNWNQGYFLLNGGDSNPVLVQWGRIHITPTAANTNTKVQIYFPFQYQGIPIVLCDRISSYPAVIQLSPEAITSDGVRISAIRDNTSPIYAVWVAIGNGSNALPE